LIKPFLALAYGRTHDTYPQYDCVGKKTCWLERGHGRLGIREAIGFSCNSYFHQLVAAAGAGYAQPTLKSFGLNDTSLDKPRFLAESRVAPIVLAHAYLQLALDRQELAADTVLQGMAISVQRGTAKAIGDRLPLIPTLAKTGTAPCIHPRKAPGDGLAMVIVPSDQPRLVLLVRLHGRPGSMAAAIAGKMVAALENEPTTR
jgi:cell division protein FtsI/penicillin-binding protein 2